MLKKRPPYGENYITRLPRAGPHSPNLYESFPSIRNTTFLTSFIMLMIDDPSTLQFGVIWFNVGGGIDL